MRFCPGMITKNTLAAMIVPSIAPKWIQAPRPENRCVSAYAAAAHSASMTAASHGSRFPSGERHRRS